MRLLPLTLAALIVLHGCATGSEGTFANSVASDVETQLRLAGFHLVPADTPQRIEALHGMPPLVFSRVMRNERRYFVYTDPVACLCLYVGTPANYEQYLRLASEADAGFRSLVAQDIEIQVDVWDPEWGTIDDPMDPVADPDL